MSFDRAIRVRADRTSFKFAQALIPTAITFLLAPLTGAPLGYLIGLAGVIPIYWYVYYHIWAKPPGRRNPTPVGTAVVLLVNLIVLMLVCGLMADTEVEDFNVFTAILFAAANAPTALFAAMAGVGTFIALKLMKDPY